MSAAGPGPVHLSAELTFSPEVAETVVRLAHARGMTGRMAAKLIIEFLVRQNRFGGLLDEVKAKLEQAKGDGG